MTEASETINIAIISEDLLFIKKISDGLIKSFDDKEFPFFMFDESDDGHSIGSFFVEHEMHDFNLVIIDFSTDFHLRLDFLKIIKKYFSFRDFSIIGALNDQAEFFKVEQVVSEGCKICHFKKEDMEDFIYDIYFLLFEENKMPPRATAENLYDVEWSQAIGKIKKFSGDEILIETKFKNFDNEDASLEKEMFPEAEYYKYFPPIEGESAKRTEWLQNQNTYYAKSALPLKFKFDTVFGSVSSKNTADEKPRVYTFQGKHFSSLIEKEDFQAKISHALEALSKEPCNVRVMAIDRKLHLLTALKDEYEKINFNVFSFPYLHKDFSILKHITPQILIFELDDEEVPVVVEESEEDSAPPAVTEEEPKVLNYFLKNDNDTLDCLLKSLKDHLDVMPTVIVFNTNSKSEAYRKLYGFDTILAAPFNMEVNFVNKLVGKYVNKSSNLAGSGNKDFYDARTKLLPDYITMEFPIIIKKIDEHFIYFKSTKDLLDGASFVLELDEVKFVVTIFHSLGSDEKMHYMGIIHGLGEVEIMDLRQYINTMIFRPKQLERIQEKQSFDSVQTQAQQKMTDEEQAKIDEQDKQDEE